MPPISSTQLPNKLRLCVLDKDKGHPLQGVPIRIILNLSNPRSAEAGSDIVFDPRVGSSLSQTYVEAVNVPSPSEFEVSLGLLASNHAGYIAFDLSSKKQLWSRNQTPHIVTAIYAEVPVDPPLRVELTAQFDGSDLAELIPVSLPGTFADSKLSGRGLNSIQSPDLDDWLLSPGSFGADAVPIIGENGCEVLLPSHAAERIIRFHQIIRTPNSAEFPPTISFSPEPSYEEDERNPEAGWSRQLYYKTGELHHYEMVWLPLNHGLGKVLYSLTLAPCEAVRIAVVDWLRSEEAGRTEQASLSDDLTHALRRDRTIEEVVNAVLRERQSGDSFMGGTAGVGGYGGGFGGGGMGGMPTGGGGTPGGSGSSGSGASNSSSGGQGGGQQAGQNWGVTGSHSIGYAMANSSGNRDVDVETTQDLIDEIAQASHLVRDLRSTVIVQASQRERETVQTRIVRNHNHSHALTVLYYEVVRHYLIRALRRNLQPVIFIKYPTITFDQSVRTRTLLRKYMDILRNRLLDNSFSAGFDALYPINDSDFIGTGGARVMGLVVNFQTGDDSTNHDRLKLILVTVDGKPIVKDIGRGFSVVPHYFNAGPRDGLFVDELFNNEASNSFFIDMTYRERYAPEEPSEEAGSFVVSPYELRRIGFVFNKDGNDDWTFNGVTVYAAIQYFDNLGDQRELVKILDTRANGVEPFKVRAHGDWIWDVDFSTASARLQQARQRAIDLIELIDHLDTHRLYYNSLIWLNENPNERAVRFADYQLGGTSLIENIDNRPLGVVGDYLAFRLVTAQPNLPPPEAEIVAERIISMPTRGAFAEAKLSHCNASEVIDDTRFWDWQISPCPDEPTEILPVNVGTRRSDFNVTPSTLPSPGVSISEPPSAPEPFGMREVMELLRTPEIFRNMSGIEELGSLLEKLVEVAGEVEKARIGATTELATAGRDADASSESRSSTPQRTDTPSVDSSTATSTSPQTVSRQIANAERAIDRVENPELQETLRRETAERAVDSVGSARSSTPRRPRLRERRLSFIFKTESGLPMRGEYEVIVQNTVDDIQRIGATPSPTGNRVTVTIPADWRTAAITVSVRSANVIGEGDFVRLREWLQGLAAPFWGSTTTAFPLETALEQAVIDPDEEASILFDCIFTSRTRTITVEATADAEAEIRGNLSPNVAAILRVGEIGGSLGGSAGGSISTQFELISLTGRLNIRQRSS